MAAELWVGYVGALLPAVPPLTVPQDTPEWPLKALCVLPGLTVPSPISSDTSGAEEGLSCAPAAPNPNRRSVLPRTFNAEAQYLEPMTCTLDPFPKTFWGHGLPMTINTCGAPTKNGATCTHPVTYGSKQCAAGHVVLPSQWGSEPALEVSTNVAAAMTGSADFEEALGFALLDDIELPDAAPVVLEEHPVETAEKRRQHLIKALCTETGMDPLLFTATGTVAGTRKRLSSGEEVGYELERFDGGVDGSLHLAYGNLGNGGHWHYCSPCTSPDCSNEAYTRIRKSHTWSPKNPALFVSTVADAHGRKDQAKCLEHRELKDPDAN